MLYKKIKSTANMGLNKIYPMMPIYRISGF